MISEHKMSCIILYIFFFRQIESQLIQFRNILSYRMTAISYIPWFPREHDNIRKQKDVFL